MPSSLTDTDPKIEAILIEGYRRMSPAQKVRCVRDMGIFSARLILADVKARYPEAEEEECRLRAASRWLPADLMLKAFGWNVKAKGY